MDKGGLGEFPIPISTPDTIARRSHRLALVHPRSGNGPYQHRQLPRPYQKPDTRTGVFLSSSNHGGYHWRKCQERGIPLQPRW